MRIYCGKKGYAYEASLKPMSVSELKERALAAEKDIKEGNLIDIDDLNKEMED
ncbi:MAG: hypothetical protein ACE5FF_07370 [Saprospiraceae bacterium]